MQIWGDALVLYATRLFSQVQTLEYRKVIIDFPKLLIFFRERRESISDMILANMSQQVMFTSTLQFYYCKKAEKIKEIRKIEKNFFLFQILIFSKNFPQFFIGFLMANFILTIFFFICSGLAHFSGCQQSDQRILFSIN